jgi:hypothetical protein
LRQGWPVGGPVAAPRRRGRAPKSACPRRRALSSATARRAPAVASGARSRG